MRPWLLAAGCLIIGAAPACSAGSSAPASLHHTVDLVTALKTAPRVSTFTVHVTKAVSTARPMVDVEDASYDLSMNAYSNHTSGSAHSHPFEELSIGRDLYIRRTGARGWVQIVRPPALFPRVRPEQPGLLFEPAVQQAKVTVVGKTSISGVTTTHYRAVEPYSTYLQAEGADAPATDAVVTTDLFLDERGLPRRVEQVLPTAGGTLRTVRLYSAYGANVDLHRPPASEILRSVTPHDQADLAAEIAKVTE